MVNPLTDLVPTPCSRTFFPPPASLSSVLAGVGGLWLSKNNDLQSPSSLTLNLSFESPLRYKLDY